MKRTLALGLVLCTLLAAFFPLTAYTSPEDTAPITEALTTAPFVTVPPASTDEPPSTVEPPVTAEPPVTDEPTEEEALLSALYEAIYRGDPEYAYETASSSELLSVNEICARLLSDYPEFFLFEWNIKFPTGKDCVVCGNVSGLAAHSRYSKVFKVVGVFFACNCL